MICEIYIFDSILGNQKVMPACFVGIRVSILIVPEEQFLSQMLTIFELHRLYTGLTCTSAFGFIMLVRTNWEAQAALAVERIGASIKETDDAKPHPHVVIQNCESDCVSLVHQAGSA
jgi:hypothetical protein